MEINGLEQINHSFGREKANQVLAAVVRAVRRSLRAADFLFRYRDDEFLVVLLQTDVATSELIASRIRDAITKEPDSGVPLDVTLIISAAPGDGNSIEELVRAAESRLDDVRTNRLSRRRRPDSVH
jgi:diguanylate cyclase (GGDEF)-like protein